jgi:Beta-propeller repeat
VTGETWSNAFPTTPGAYKTSCGNSGDCVYDSNLGNFRSDAFVTKLGPGGTVVWSTFIGGHTVCCGGIPVDSRNYDRGNGIAVDSAGQVVVVGTTDATDFPTTPNAISPTYTTGLSKAFIAKLNAAGTDLVYSTFFGGSHTVEGNAVTLDAGGDAYVVGNTNSPDMLVTSGAFQPTCGQGAGCATWESNAFAAKLSPTGSLLASTYLGSGDPAGGAADRGHAIAVDASGNAYLMGMTTHVLGSTTVKPFPTTPGAYSTTYRGLGDVFVSKLNSSLTQLVYSTLLGGTDDDSAQWGGIAVDSSGSAVVTGYTNSTDFPVVNAIQPAYGGGFYDAFAARFDPTGSALVYSTYLGGVYDDYGYAVTVDGSGNAYLTGSTLSPNFPVGNATPTVLPGNLCGTDYCLLAFLTELAPSGSLVYSDELGGTLGQEALGLAIDSTGTVYLGGDTFSPDFPTLAPAQPAYAGGDCSATTDSHIISIVVYRCGDGFVTKLLPDKSTGQLRATTSPALPSQILVDGVIRDSWGLNWVDLPTGTHTVSFTHVEGYTEPAPQTVTISAGVVSTLAGDFVQRGSLRVITSPAVPGAISVDGSPRNNWGMWTDLPAGQHQVCFGPVANFTPPACQSVTLTAGSLSTITGVYTSGSGQPGPAGTGQLRVTTTPALPSQILVNGTPMDSWGLNWVDLAPGTYTVAFTHVEGYTEPAPRTVTVSAGAVATVQANFTQRGSLRVITSPAAPATIVVDGLPRDNWGMWSDLAAGSHTVCFGRAAGLVSPPCQTATIVAGQLTTVTGTFTASTSRALGIVAAWRSS